MMQRFEQLDAYTDGDPDFKVVLMKLIIENLQELKQSLSEAMSQNDPTPFSKACHKAKTTLVMLNIAELSNTSEELIKTIQAHDKSRVFIDLCDNLIRNLADEIARV
jgi:HPt (histidine-containing phosphotransfer) domain-containing protein